MEHASTRKHTQELCEAPSSQRSKSSKTQQPQMSSEGASARRRER